jgi:hypothetical protein
MVARKWGFVERLTKKSVEWVCQFFIYQQDLKFSRRMEDALNNPQAGIKFDDIKIDSICFGTYYRWRG